MLTAPACPDIGQYKKLATGQLSTSDKEALLNHLESCQVCVQRVESLSEKDTLVDWIRQARTLEEGPAGETIARLVQRVRGLRPANSEPDAAAKVPTQILSCSGCGKNVKVKTALAGKKVKCPHCQSVIPVPVDIRPQELSQSPPSEIGEAMTLAPTSSAGGKSSAGTVPTQAQPVGTDPHLYDFLAPAQSPDELGRLGPYRVLRVLGAGGMGVVFQAEDPHLQRLVALKAMLPGLAAGDAAKQRFLREARAAAKLKHDHIVTIFQVGEDRGVPFLAMEFLEGEPLDDRLKREGKLPLTDLLRIGREMAEGLAAAHERGLIHRDIKPANVWLEGKKGRVKILDFGLARASADEAQITQSGAIVGTPAYMAPEQAKGKKVEPRSDLFSLGCVLYRLATGEAPFKGPDIISTLMAVATENPAPPQSLNLELPADLSDFIMQLLAKKPAERPESAQVVAETLERIARAEQPAKIAKAGSRPKKAQSAATGDKPVRGRGGRRIAVAALVLALLVPLGYWLSGIIVSISNPDGVLIVEVTEPNADVYVNGNNTVVTWDKGRQKAEIRVKPGTQKVEVKVLKDGFKIVSEDVDLEQNGRTIFNAKLIPNPPPLTKGADGLTPAPETTLPRTFKNSLGMEFILVPGGKSWLGGGYGKEGAEVNIARNFYLGVYEVTQEEWQKIMDKNPSHFTREKVGKEVSDDELKRFPVENVSWEEAKVFVNLVNEKLKKDPMETGWEYRLPTELQWEYACRGGQMIDKTESVFDFYFEKPTNTLSREQANFRDSGLKRPRKVGSYPPNRLGLYDMHGNTSEWCDDAGGTMRPVARGGGWGSDCHAALRFMPPMSIRDHGLGLRLARVPVRVGDEPKLYLRDLKEFDRVLHDGRGPGDGLVIVKGEKFEKGLLTHPPGPKSDAIVKYRLDGLDAFVFETKVAINDTVPKGTLIPLTFQVLGDGKVLWTSKPMQSIRETDDCSVTVEGVHVLELRVLCPGPNDRGHAAWLDPCLVTTNKAALPATPLPTADGFVPLFNGKDLTGWHVESGNAGQWTVEGDAIVGRSADFRTRDYLLSNKDYADFTLNLEFMTVPGTGGGVVFRAVDGERLVDDGRCDHPTLKITAPETHGEYSSGTTHWVKNDKLHTRPTEDLKLPSGAWHTLEITVRGDTCTALLAGKKIVDIRLDPASGNSIVPGLKRSEGKIGFQTNGGTVRYRKIKIKELPPVKASDPAATGFAPPTALMVQKFQGHTLLVRCVAVSNDGKLALTGSWDKTAILWDAASGKKIHTFEAHTSGVNSVALTGDGKLALTGSWDKTAILWDAASGKKIHTFEAHTGLHAVAVSAEGRHVVTGSEDRAAILWDAASGKKIQTFEGHKGAVTSVALSGDSKLLVTGSGDNTAILWETASGKKLQTFRGHADPVLGVALSGDGKLVLTGSRDNTATLWEAASGKKIQSFLVHTDEVIGVALGSDGKLVLTASADKTAILWDAASGKKIHTLQGHTDRVNGVALSGDGKLVLTGAADKTAILWAVNASPPGTSKRFTNSLGMEFALVPKGKSWLGGGNGKEGTTEVNMAQDFYLSAFEVTQEEWQKIMGKNPSQFSRERVGNDVSDDELKHFPVESVSWAEAKEFVRLVNEKTKKDGVEAGWKYRLPFEHEWEYACRGGPMADKAESAFDFYFEKPASTLSREQANFVGSGLKRPRKVGSYPPNRLGLYDMHGNVWEWCEDQYKGGPAHLFRGGCWLDPPGVCQAAFLNFERPPLDRRGTLGLRLARVPVGKDE